MAELFPNFHFESKPQGTVAPSAASEGQPPNFVPMSDFWAENLLLQAKRFRDLEPWNRIRENEFIGIEHPQTGEVSLISVLGRGCELFALHLHKPPQGIEFWHRALQGKPPKPAPAFEHLNMLECEFVSKDDITPKNMAFVKKYSKPSRKRRGIPCFRSYRPGFYPWQLDDYEAQELSMVFDLFFLYCDTAFPSKHQSFYNWAKSEDETHEIPFLKLKPEGSASYLSDWQIVTQPIPDKPDINLHADLNKAQPAQSDNTLELYLFSQKNPTNTKNNRPFFPTIAGMFLNQDEQPVERRSLAPTKSKSELGVAMLAEMVSDTRPQSIKIYTDSNIEPCERFLESKAIPNQIVPIDPKSERFSKLLTLSEMDQP